MKQPFLLITMLAAATALALPEQNLVPNGDFSDKTNPLKGWRYTYPHQQQQYGKNHEYIHVAERAGKRCVEFAVPKSQGNAGGAMLETAFIKCEPGATYKAEVECCPKDMRMIIFIEAWVPLPEQVVMRPGLRVWPAEEGRPRLMMCHRKQAPRLSASSNWTTVRDTLTVPKTVDINVNGKLTPTAPEYISIKAYVDYPSVSGPNVTYAYVANFRLTKVK